jgi:hypothetical protein
MGGVGAKQSTCYVNPGFVHYVTEPNSAIPKSATFNECLAAALAAKAKYIGINNFQADGTAHCYFGDTISENAIIDESKCSYATATTTTTQGQTTVTETIRQLSGNSPNALAVHAVNTQPPTSNPQDPPTQPIHFAPPPSNSPVLGNANHGGQTVVIPSQIRDAINIQTAPPTALIPQPKQLGGVINDGFNSNVLQPHPGPSLMSVAIRDTKMSVEVMILIILGVFFFVLALVALSIFSIPSMFDTTFVL